MLQRSVLIVATATLWASAVTGLAEVPVILDTDIGTDIDDALALALVLASPELELQGVTTVSDDAYTRAMIACRFLEAVGRGDVPVAAGRDPREEPAVGGQYQYGLRPGRKRPEKERAVQFLHDRLKSQPGQITVIAVGDLTNLAELFSRHPESKRWLRRLVLMGGAVRVGYGNTAHREREWNLRSDVKAAQAVFRSGIPLVVAPLDATVEVRLTAPLRRRLFAAEGNPLCGQLQALYELWDKETPVLFDPVAVALAMDESFCTMEDLRLEVDDEAVTREVRGTPNCRVAMDIRAEAYLEWYVQRILQWRQGAGEGGLLLPATARPRRTGPVNPVPLAAPGGLPARVHVAEDDIQFYADRHAGLLIDDIVLFDAAPANGKHPFPRRIHFTGWFDTGKQGREWPGDFEIVAHEKPRTWFAARSIPREKPDGPWLRVGLRGSRPLGERTLLRFCYRLAGADGFRLALANTPTGEQAEAALERTVTGAWTEATVEFCRPGPRRLRHADEIRFLLVPGAELLVDDLLLYEPDDAGCPRRPVGHAAEDRKVDR